MLDQRIVIFMNRPERGGPISKYTRIIKTSVFRSPQLFIRYYFRKSLDGFTIRKWTFS